MHSSVQRRRPRRRAIAWLVVVPIVIAPGLAACDSSPTPTPLPVASGDAFASPLPGGTDGTVDRVVDGDTIVVDGRRVRLIGIDTPETVKPDSPVQCYGPEASAATKALLPKGTAVRLVDDVERQDRYGRDLAYVYRTRDGLFVSGYLAQQGFARTLSIPPNTAQRARLAALADEARRDGRGLWSACA